MNATLRVPRSTIVRAAVSNLQATGWPVAVEVALGCVIAPAPRPRTIKVRA